MGRGHRHARLRRLRVTASRHREGVAQMTVYILTVVMFLTGGIVVTHSVQAPDMDDCEAARPLIEKQLLETQVTIGDEKKMVLDVQTLPCVAVTQQQHA